MKLTKHARPRVKASAGLMPQRDIERIVKAPPHVRAALVMEVLSVKRTHPDIRVSDAAANALDRIRRTDIKQKK